jgi:hypothetical protein
MNTGSTRLSLAHCAEKLIACADKLIVEKQSFETKSQELNKMASEFLDMSYMFKVYQENPALVGQEFEIEADGTVVLL